jgi:ABC-type uncharacterized transport system permease subunit
MIYFLSFLTLSFFLCLLFLPIDWRSIHILISIITYGVLGLAALQATLLYFQNTMLRSKHSGGVLRFFPPLQTMDTLLFQIIWLGFLLLSASLASAWFLINETVVYTQIHKVIFSFLAWSLFATLLYGHYRSGWRGLTAVRWTLSGVLLLIVAYFSSNLLVLKYWS